MDLQLKPGDVFCTHSPTILGQLINFFQKIWEDDNSCSYSHAGFMLDNVNTFEALWTVHSQNIYEAYKGKYVLIARHEKINDEVFKNAFEQVKHYERNLYPVHRLLLQIIPPLAKLSFGFVVCSELTAKFLYRAYILTYWRGMSPSELENILKNWRGWTVIYEGIL